MNEPIVRLQEFLDQALDSKREIRILEAGCGSASHFHCRQQKHVTGIDISGRQLERNIQLDESIVGDVQKHAFPPSSFDIIICWTVLEHLDQPELALERFVGCIKPGGLIILSLPNVLSLKGIITKYLPFSLHKWYYKTVSGRRDAGKDDKGPFKTYLRRTVAPNAIRRFAAQSRLQVVYFDSYDAGDATVWQQRALSARVVIRIYNLLRIICNTASFGLLGDSEFIIVLRK